MLAKERKHECTHVEHNQLDDPLPYSQIVQLSNISIIDWSV